MVCHTVMLRSTATSVCSMRNTDINAFLSVQIYSTDWSTAKAHSCTLQIPEDREDAKARVKKVITSFIAALHPDKHSGKGSGTEHDQKVAAFTQVTAYLNEVYGCFKCD